MAPKADNSDHDVDYGDKILSAAALFDGEFSLDWVIETTFRKASEVLLALEHGVSEGWLGKGNRADIYFFRDEGKRKKLVVQMAPNEREHLHQRIVSLIKIGISQGSDNVEALTTHLMQLSNDTEGCKLLIRAAKSYRSKFQFEKAIVSLSWEEEI